MKGKGQKTKTGKTIEEIVAFLTEKWTLAEHYTAALQAICSRADGTDTPQVVLSNSTEGKKLQSCIERIGKLQLAESLERSVEIKGMKITFHPRATKARQLQEVA